MIKSFSGQVVFYFAILIAISAYVGENWLSQYTFCIIFDLILYVPSTIFQLNREGSSWVEPALS